MRILVVGALSWNPERIRTLHERGHELWGLWSRSMAWDQGPYPVLVDCVREVGLADAPETIRRSRIDCVYGLLQAYDPRHWGPPAPRVEHGVWTILRTLLHERDRGAFDAPLVWHSGFDVQNLDLGVAHALDGHLLCNREKLAYWTTDAADGGCGLDVLGDCPVVDYLDSDRPKLELMNDRFAARLSDATGEVHTVCVGRPFGVDVLAAARCGIHVHVYPNGVDDVHRSLARTLGPRDARRHARLLRRYLHVHPSLQTVGSTWPEVRRVKGRWVEEFSRYDAGWSYVGSPFRRAPLDDRAALANKVGTYLLAGLPVITDRRSGHYRYEELRRLGVELELPGSAYDALRERLDEEIATSARRRQALARREEYSFDATIDPLLATLERARERYFARSHAERSRFAGGPSADPRRLDGPPGQAGGPTSPERVGAAWRERVGLPRTARRLRAALAPGGGAGT